MLGHKYIHYFNTASCIFITQELEHIILSMSCSGNIIHYFKLVNTNVMFELFRAFLLYKLVNHN